MPAPLTLFTLPCAGASAAMYLRWRRRLPSWAQIQPIELPGRGGRLHEASEETFEALVDLLVDELEASPPQRYALFGHSMGGLLAFGIAHSLYKRKRLLPVALLISACAAPSRQDWRRYANKNTEAALIGDLRKQNGTPEEVFESDELLSMTLSLLRADYRVCGSFRYEELPPLPIPMHVFGGRADEIHESKLEAWQCESSKDFSLDWFEGGHFFLRQQEEVFLSVLEQRLARSRIEVNQERCAADLSHAVLGSA
jgi:surfactin synthase thioesterase subunit